MDNMVQYKQVEDRIITIRAQSVILDSDVAELYGVETKRVNEAVSNNPEKFPDGYILSLDNEEWTNLKSKFSTSSWGGKNKLPNAFTEKGLYMLATILKSPQATQTTIAIVETFMKIRDLSRTVAALAATREKGEQKSLMQKGGDIIAELLGSDMQITDAETNIEINFALMKFKQTIKHRRKTEDK
jgi:hypothetical protein